MSSIDVLPRPVDTTGTGDEDTGVHLYCEHAQLTWCGEDARKHVVARVSEVQQVCRVCLLALEMLTPGRCPVCGCAACVG